MESATVDVLDGNQDTEPRRSDIKAGLSSPRQVSAARHPSPPALRPYGTIPEDLNAIPRQPIAISISLLPEVIFEERTSNQAWMIPVLLGLVALLAVDS